MKNIKDTRPVFAGLQDKKLPGIPTPAYVIDEERLCYNGKILQSLIEESGCKILLAQKAFSNYDFYPLLSNYISGTEASGLYEAKLGYEEMPGKEVHVFCGAYRDEEMDEIMQYADHIVFNSIYQLKKFGPLAKAHHKSLGLRINPQYSTQQGHDIYDPCAPKSRLGVTYDVWQEEMDAPTFSLLDGLHFHTLCEQNSDDLKKTLIAFDQSFGKYMKDLKWINMGGGHHITRHDYDIQTLKDCIAFAQKTWNVEVYLEPGEAIAYNAGYLVTSVLDLVNNGNDRIAILDSSAACHMPDVIEMPYTPMVWQASTAQDENHPYLYRLAGPTCLSGDIIGDYYFSDPLKRNDILIFGDMAIYTTCKNNTFNGMPLPSIYSWKIDGSMQCVAQFDYSDFKNRLGKRK